MFRNSVRTLSFSCLWSSATSSGTFEAVCPGRLLSDAGVAPQSAASLWMCSGEELVTV